jgi:hypothetical protein
MLNIPASMQPTLDRWKQTQSLGDGMKFGSFGDASQYEQLMDQVVRMDNSELDASPERGVVVAQDDGETIRFQGDSKRGFADVACADGRVVALNFTPESVDFLQLTEKPEGVEAMHQHFDRATGQSWMQIGGAVTLINMDAPGALDQIFGLNPSAPAAPSLSAENAAKAEALGAKLADKLQVSADAVRLASFEQKGFNAGNCGFAVKDELQMSAWTEGLELKFECGGEKYVYRGLDEKTGRYGVDVAHEGYWKQDGRGIYVVDNTPDNSLDMW